MATDRADLPPSAWSRWVSPLLVAAALTTGCAHTQRAGSDNQACNATDPETAAAEQLEDLVQFSSIGRMFERGERTPIDLLYFEPGDGGPRTYYQVELTMRTDHDGVVTIADMDTHAPVLEFYLDVRETSLVPMDVGDTHEGLSDLVVDNYTRWCGKWHQGSTNYWQFCTGSDCGSSDSTQWCIKKVYKQDCGVLGNCPG